MVKPLRDMSLEELLEVRIMPEVDLFTRYVDYVAKEVWGIDNGTKYLCMDKLYQHREQKCYKAGGDYTCVDSDKIVSVKVRHCIEVDNFNSNTFWKHVDDLKKKMGL